MIQGFEARLPRSNNIYWRTALPDAMTPTATRDGLPPGEGVFLACSFWLADSLLATGRRVGSTAAIRAAAYAQERCRTSVRRIRPRREATGWQFPTGTFAYCACKHGSQLHAFGKAGPAKIWASNHEQLIGLTTGSIVRLEPSPVPRVTL